VKIKNPPADPLSPLNPPEGDFNITFANCFIKVFIKKIISFKSPSGGFRGPGDYFSA
jgi:hypothetical protein